MPVMVAVVVQECLEIIEFRPKPLCIAAIGLNEKCGMLGQTWLVHILLVNMIRLSGAVPTRQDGNPAVHSTKFEKVQYAAPLIGSCSFLLRDAARFHEDLSQGDVAEP